MSGVFRALFAWEIGGMWIGELWMFLFLLVLMGRGPAPSDSPLGTPSEALLGACLGGVVGLRMSGTSVPRCSKRG
eukprot:11224458-Ditylum_brightwellii.AAC.1